MPRYHLYYVPPKVPETTIDYQKVVTWTIINLAHEPSLEEE